MYARAGRLQPSRTRDAPAMYAPGRGHPAPARVGDLVAIEQSESSEAKVGSTYMVRAVNGAYGNVFEVSGGDGDAAPDPTTAPGWVAALAELSGVPVSAFVLQKQATPAFVEAVRGPRLQLAAKLERHECALVSERARRVRAELELGIARQEMRWLKADVSRQIMAYGETACTLRAANRILEQQARRADEEKAAVARAWENGWEQDKREELERTRAGKRGRREE